MKIIFLIICFLLIASAAYADPIAGQWSSLSPCVNNLRVWNDHTFYLWQACPDDDCYVISEFAGTWEKISSGIYALYYGNEGDIVLLKGTVVVGTNGETMLKGVSIDSLKPTYYQYQCQ